MSSQSYALADLVDAPALQSLMTDFYEIARIPMAVIDIQGRVLVGAGWQDICTQFHRVNPETCQACLESDVHLSAGVPAGQFRRYRCKNNMWDLATPIVVGEDHVGNVFSGQFFFNDEPIDYAAFRAQAQRYRFDEAAYMAALDRVPRLSREAVDRALAFFVKLAHMVSQLGEANLRLRQAVADREAMTTSLRESEADLARAQAVANTGSWRLDVCHNRLTWSAEVYRMFGVPQGTALTYDTFLDRVHPDDRATVDAAWQAALTGQPYDVQHRIIVGDEEKWVRETAELEFDQDGNLRSGFGTVQDITRHKLTEQALRDSHEVLRTTIDTTPDLVFLKDAHGRYVVVNDAAAKMIGKPIDAIIGKDDNELFPDHIARRFIEGDRLLMQSGSSLVLEETIVLDGRVRHLLTSKSVCRDSNGGIAGVVGIGRDVSDWKQAEAALQQSEARLAGILEQLPVGVGLMDCEGRLVVSNSLMRQMIPAMIPSRDPERIRRWRATRPDGTPLDPSEWPGARALRGETVVPGVEFIHQDEKGQESSTRVAAAPFYDATGVVRGAITVVQDISQSKQLEAELKKTVVRLEEGNRLKDEFLSTLSHELRTPLNAILGWSHMLRSYGAGYAHADHAIEAVSRNAQSLTRLVEDVLDVSRIITGKLHLRQQPVDVVAVIERALDTVRPAADAREIRIVTSLNQRGVVVGDADRLQQVMWNLLSNAVKFNHKGGEIRVAVEQLDSQVHVHVADTGIGIAPEFIPRLFERFSQHDGSTTRAYGGLGLGLAIVRHLVEMHGGTVRGDSAGPQQGAVFTITLPVRAVVNTADDRCATQADTSLASLTPPSLNGTRVLVVDDDESARDLLQTVLTDFGAEVLVASSAAEGLEQVQAVRPHVLISDIGMPDEDGYSFMRKVRQLPAAQGGAVPAIALTAYGHENDRQQALAAGYAQHVVKPVIAQELVRVVAAFAPRGGGDTNA